MNNIYGDKKGQYDIRSITLEDVDQSIFNYFDKKISIHVDTDKGRSKVPIIYASGERWKLIRDNKGLRDENGTLILPLISVRRTLVDRTPGFGGMAQEVPEVTISRIIHDKTGNMQNLVKSRNINGFIEKKRDPVIETLTIPYPDFCIIFYEIILWAQYQSQMNEMLEKIFYNYDIRDSFVVPLEYDENAPKNGFYFVGFRDGNLPSQSNVEEFTSQERIIKYTYNIKVPVYLILNPKDETLSYGKDDEGKKVVYKSQNTVSVKLKEQVLSAEEFEKLFG
jgi:hypothetical protein